jgi:hypothetical protein
MYLSVDAMQRIVGSSITLVPVDTGHYFDGTHGGFAERFVKCTREILGFSGEAGYSHDVLLVTHGDGLGVLGSALQDPITVYDVQYCGVRAESGTCSCLFVVFRSSFRCPKFKVPQILDEFPISCRNSAQSTLQSVRERTKAKTLLCKGQQCNFKLNAGEQKH